MPLIFRESGSLMPEYWYSKFRIKVVDSAVTDSGSGNPCFCANSISRRCACFFFFFSDSEWEREIISFRERRDSIVDMGRGRNNPIGITIRLNWLRLYSDLRPIRYVPSLLPRFSGWNWLQLIQCLSLNNCLTSGLQELLGIRCWSSYRSFEFLI